MVLPREAYRAALYYLAVYGDPGCTPESLSCFCLGFNLCGWSLGSCLLKTAASDSAAQPWPRASWGSDQLQPQVFSASKGTKSLPPIARMFDAKVEAVRVAALWSLCLKPGVILSRHPSSWEPELGAD